MAEETKKVVAPSAKETAPKEETVSKAQFDNLYNQAVALEKRFNRLIDLFNIIVDKYISCDATDNREIR